MPLISEIISAIEAFAPTEWQESWDNSGYQVGTPGDEASGALLTFDVTENAIDQAIELGYNLVISHHPLLFSGLKRITDATPTERIVMRAIRHGITIYSCHTNIDSAPGGINYRLAEILGIRSGRPLDRQPLTPEGVGLGFVGELLHPTTLGKLLENIKSHLNLKAIRVSNPANLTRTVNRIAMCGGSGGSLLDSAIDSHADVYITGDLKYHDFQRATHDLTLIDVGHRESEIQVLDIFSEQISKKFPNFAVRLSAGQGANPVEFYI